MTQSSTTTDLSAFSNQLADAVEAAGAWTLRVHGRRGTPASGIALSSDLVVTADHVIDPQREGSLRVGLTSGDEAAATLVGRDPATDVAVLRVTGGTLAPAAAAANAPRVGSLALAVARPGGQPSASLALVAGLGEAARTRGGGLLERYLLVDTVMYPGFSGGPLVAAGGGVLGMNTSGLGFGGPSVAIPWDVATKLAETISQHGRVARGFLGIGSQPIALSAAAKDLAGGQERGLLVLNVAEGGPAGTGGVLQGDIVVAMAGETISSADDLQALLGPDRVGQTAPVKVVRGGELRELSVVVGARP